MIFEISTQEEFNNLRTNILNAINSGDNSIEVKFSANRFYFNNDNYILLENITNENLSITFTGVDGTIITAEGFSYPGNICVDKLSYRNGFIATGYNENKNKCKIVNWFKGLFGKSTEYIKPSYLTNWSKYYQSDELISSTDEIIGDNEYILYKIKYDNIQINLDCSYMYINIPSWYRSYNYKVNKIDSGYIYFQVPYNENKDYLVTTLNGDYHFDGKNMPRFRLSNYPEDDKVYFQKENGQLKLFMPTGIASAYICEYSQFLDIKNCTIDELCIHNIKFEGNSTTTDQTCPNYINKGNELIKIENCRYSKCDISYCKFININTQSILIYNYTNSYNKDKNTDTYTNIYYNEFNYCTNGVIVIYNKPNALIYFNSFNNCGLEQSNKGTVVCMSYNYEVTNNKFYNYGWSAIMGGIHRGSNPAAFYPGICSGKIHHNYLVNSSDYVLPTEDSGAIYIYTFSGNANDTTADKLSSDNKVIVNNNYIDHYDGIYFNRGIFCDDGTKNVSILNNVILNTPNSYSIDCREVPEYNSGKDTYSNIGISSINNLISGNIFDNNIRFEGRYNGNRDPQDTHLSEDFTENNCKLENNYCSNNVSNVISHVTETGSINIINSDEFKTKCSEILNSISIDKKND